MNIEKKGDRERDGERGCLNFQQIFNYKLYSYIIYFH